MRSFQIFNSNSLEVRKMRKREKNKFAVRPGISGKISSGTIIFLAVFGAVCFYAYFWWIEPRLEAANFEDSLEKFGAPSFHISRDYSEVAEGEIPYRIGKVLVVIPEHKIYPKPKGVIVPPKIHPIWYKLDRGMRKRRPPLPAGWWL
jgi:hypothetical protein